ncbi:MAG: hypothetical protein WCB00_11345 [Candidatus Acidiferrales bacterium]
MTRTNVQTVAIALARIPRTGSLRNELRDEADVVTKRLRPVLRGYRLGAMLYALMTLTAEYTRKLLEAETAGCDCLADRENGLYKCASRKHHALTTIEENDSENS